MTCLPLVFAPFHDRSVHAENEGAAPALAPRTAAFLHGKTVAHGGAFTFDDRIVDIEFPAWTVTKEFCEVLDDRFAAGDRCTSRFVIGAIEREMRGRTKRIAFAPRIEEIVERLADRQIVKNGRERQRSDSCGRIA